MNRVNIIILFVTVVIVTGIWLFLDSSSKDNVDFVRALDASPSEFEREVVEVSIQSSILADTTYIFRPAQIRINSNFTYVNDFADFTIYEYDSEGNQKRKLTTTRGRGPGEIQHLTDFEVKNDTIWIADSQSMRVTSYSLSTGEYIDNYSLESRPMRVTVLEDGFVVLWLGAEKLFSKFDFQGNEIHHFGEIIEDQILHQLSMDGTIRSNGQDRFVYIPFYASLIYHFDSEGNKINILKAPDGVNFPSVRRDGPTTFAPDFLFMRDGFIDEDDNLYVYVTLPDEISQNDQDNNYPESYIDKYSLSSAEYVNSFRMHEHFSSVMYNPYENIIYASDFEKSFLFQLGRDF
ncbi:MAG TPA: 6-bladed beta-propeller [Balneolaceae bacterium]|nr:6-bladed beta-propeller [Balneolaceae bacterium]